MSFNKYLELFKLNNNFSKEDLDVAYRTSIVDVNADLNDLTKGYLRLQKYYNKKNKTIDNSQNINTNLSNKKYKFKNNSENSSSQNGKNHKINNKSENYNTTNYYNTTNNDNLNKYNMNKFNKYNNKYNSNKNNNVNSYPNSIYNNLYTPKSIYNTPKSIYNTPKIQVDNITNIIANMDKLHKNISNNVQSSLNKMNLLSDSDMKLSQIGTSIEDIYQNKIIDTSTIDNNKNFRVYENKIVKSSYRNSNGEKEIKTYKEVNNNGKKFFEEKIFDGKETHITRKLQIGRAHV